jgi:hypothetical protein
MANTMTCCDCSNMADSHRNQITCSSEIMSTEGNKAWKRSAYCFRSRLNTQRTFSFFEETTSAPRSIESTASMTNVCGAFFAHLRTTVPLLLTRRCRQAPVQHQDLEDLHRLLQLPAGGRAYRREDFLHAWRTLPGDLAAPFLPSGHCTPPIGTIRELGLQSRGRHYKARALYSGAEGHRCRRALFACVCARAHALVLSCTPRIACR